MKVKSTGLSNKVLGNYKKWLPRIIIGSVLGILLLWFWSRYVNFPQLWQYFKTVKIGWVIVYLILFPLHFFLRSLRWRSILSPIKKIPVLNLFFIFMTGPFINFFLPIRVGELSKAYLLKKEHRISMAQSLPTIFIDKLFDLVSILILFAFIPLMHIAFPNYINRYMYIISLIAIFIIFSIIIIISFDRPIKKKTDKSINKIRQSSIRIILAWFQKLILSFTILKKLQSKSIFLLLYSIGLICYDGLILWTLFLAFGQHVSPLAIIIGYAIISITYIIPSPPAQIGSQEIFWLLIFSAILSVDHTVINSVAILQHVIMLLIFSIFGIFSITRLDKI